MSRVAGIRNNYNINNSYKNIKTSEKLHDVSRSFSSSKLHIRSKVTREKMKSDKNISGNMEILCTKSFNAFMTYLFITYLSKKK